MGAGLNTSLANQSRELVPSKSSSHFKAATGETDREDHPQC